MARPQRKRWFDDSESGKLALRLPDPRRAALDFAARRPPSPRSRVKPGQSDRPTQSPQTTHRSPGPAHVAQRNKAQPAPILANQNPTCVPPTRHTSAPLAGEPFAERHAPDPDLRERRCRKIEARLPLRASHSRSDMRRTRTCAKGDAERSKRVKSLEKAFAQRSTGRSRLVHPVHPSASDRTRSNPISCSDFAASALRWPPPQ